MGSVSGMNNHKCVASKETIKAHSFHYIFYTMNILKYFPGIKRKEIAFCFPRFTANAPVIPSTMNSLKTIPVSFYLPFKTQRPLEKSFTWLNFAEYI